MEAQDAFPEGKWPSHVRKALARGMEGMFFLCLGVLLSSSVPPQLLLS